MTDKIHPNLAKLAVDIDTLVPLPGNPRRGDVDAIAKSYDEFGQVKPIVVRPNSDGTATVIAGNHQLQAAKSLGWDKIAAVQMEADDDRALTFALADNRIAELGETDDDLLNRMLVEISEDYFPVLETLGWDDFELASIEMSLTEEDLKETTSGQYVTPQIIDPVTKFDDPAPVEAEKPKRELQANDVEARRVEAPQGIDHASTAVLGATSVGSGGAKAVVQYNLVFDEPDQQRRWYDFMRWLRSDPGTDGDTTAERLMNFLEAHVDF